MSTAQRSVLTWHKEARARWATHVSAQPDSGQNQVSYCRTHGLDPKSFSLWKRKLREPSKPGHTSTTHLVPVIVTPRASTPLSTRTVPLRLALGNGLPVSMDVALLDLSAVLCELAALRC